MMTINYTTEECVAAIPFLNTSSFSMKQGYIRRHSGNADEKLDLKRREKMTFGSIISQLGTVLTYASFILLERLADLSRILMFFVRLRVFMFFISRSLSLAIRSFSCHTNYSPNY